MKNITKSIVGLISAIGLGIVLSTVPDIAFTYIGKTLAYAITAISIVTALSETPKKNCK